MTSHHGSSYFPQDRLPRHAARALHVVHHRSFSKRASIQLPFSGRGYRPMRLFDYPPDFRFEPLFEPHLPFNAFTRNLREAGTIRTSFFCTRRPPAAIVHANPQTDGRQARRPPAAIVHAHPEVEDPAQAGRMGAKLGGLSGYLIMDLIRYQLVKLSNRSLTPSVYNPRPTGETE